MNDYGSGQQLAYRNSESLLRAKILNAAKLRRKQVADAINAYEKPRFSAIIGPVKHPMALPAPNNAVNNPVLPRGITSMERESTETE